MTSGKSSGFPVRAQIQKDGVPVIKFLWRSVDAKHLMRENAVFNFFSGEAWTGSKCFIASHQPRSQGPLSSSLEGGRERTLETRLSLTYVAENSELFSEGSVTTKSVVNKTSRW